MVIFYQVGRLQIGFICQIWGSVFPVALLISSPSTVMAGLLSLLETELRDVPLIKPLSESAAFSGFSFLTGFVIVRRKPDGKQRRHIDLSRDSNRAIRNVLFLRVKVFRTTQAYTRFNEAINTTYHMMAEWFDAASSLSAFCSRSECPKEEVSVFMHTMTRLFSLLNASALEELTDETVMRRQREGHADDESDGLTTFEVIDVQSLDEQTRKVLLSGKYSKVLLMYQWIQHLMVDACHDGIVAVSAPIAGRAFHELNVGMVKFHDALRVAKIPFPFPYAQTTVTLLLLYSLLTPVVMSQWTKTAIGSLTFTFVQVFIMWSLNAIASSMESPFGGQANDIDPYFLQCRMNDHLLLLLHPKAKTSPRLRKGTDVDHIRLMNRFYSLRRQRNEDKMRAQSHAPCHRRCWSRFMAFLFSGTARVDHVRDSFVEMDVDPLIAEHAKHHSLKPGDAISDLRRSRTQHSSGPPSPLVQPTQSLRSVATRRPSLIAQASYVDSPTMVHVDRPVSPPVLHVDRPVSEAFVPVIVHDSREESHERERTSHLSPRTPLPEVSESASQRTFARKPTAADATLFRDISTEGELHRVRPASRDSGNPSLVSGKLSDHSVKSKNGGTLTPLVLSSHPDVLQKEEVASSPPCEHTNPASVKCQPSVSSHMPDTLPEDSVDLSKDEVLVKQNSTSTCSRKDSLSVERSSTRHSCKLPGMIDSSESSESAGENCDPPSQLQVVSDERGRVNQQIDVKPVETVQDTSLREKSRSVRLMESQPEDSTESSPLSGKVQPPGFLNSEEADTYVASFTFSKSRSLPKAPEQEGDCLLTCNDPPAIRPESPPPDQSAMDSRVNSRAIETPVPESSAVLERANKDHLPSVTFLQESTSILDWSPDPCIASPQEVCAQELEKMGSTHSIGDSKTIRSSEQQLERPASIVTQPPSSAYEKDDLKRSSLGHPLSPARSQKSRSVVAFEIPQPTLDLPLEACGSEGKAASQDLRPLKRGWQRSHIGDGREFFFRTETPGMIFWKAPEEAFLEESRGDGSSLDAGPLSDDSRWNPTEEPPESMTAPDASAFDSLPQTPTSVVPQTFLQSPHGLTPGTAKTSIVGSSVPEGDHSEAIGVTFGMGVEEESVQSVQPPLTVTVTVPVNPSETGDPVIAKAQVVPAHATVLVAAPLCPPIVARFADDVSDEGDGVHSARPVGEMPMIILHKPTDGEDEMDRQPGISESISKETVNVDIAGAGFLPF